MVYSSSRLSSRFSSGPSSTSPEPGRSRGGPDDQARQILDQRCAKGEIDEEEYGASVASSADKVTTISRRWVLGLLGGGLIGLGLAGGYLLRAALRLGSTSNGMMGSATSADMSTYMDLFNRHAELRRTVDEIPGGVRTTTESDSSDLVAQLQTHVSSMYSHVSQRAEVTCMSNSLPTLFRNAEGYRRQLTLTTNGVSVTETSSDPALTAAIRKHAQEVSGFVRDGMPAMMRGMMGT